MSLIVRLVKLLPALYAIAFVGSALWAWGTYFDTKDAEREQLLPGFIFNMVCLPSSLLMDRFIDWYPNLLDSPWLLYSLLTLLGLLQVACLVLIATGLNRRSGSPGR
jgi:hypothetical protein